MSERTCPSSQELSAFMLGKLPSGTMEDVARHLDSCRACEAAVQSLESLSDPVIAGLRRHPEGSVSSRSGRGPGSAALSLPERLGDYRILREVGRGGMGVVYEAEQVSLSRRVALKVLPRHALLDPESVQRFRRESRAAARLHHTNIVQVFGTGEQDGLLYFVMQFIPGAGLDALIRELRRLRPSPASLAAEEPQSAAETSRSPRPLRDLSLSPIVRELLAGRFASGPVLEDRGSRSPSSLPPLGPPSGSSPRAAAAPLTEPAPADEYMAPTGHTYWLSVARIGIQVAEALEFAHVQGIQHRDIKPSNLLLDPHGRAWVTDFGLAKEATEPDLTRSDLLVGTLRYAPPERFKGKSDARGDVYGLGLALYELLALRPAFAEADRSKLLEQVMHGEPPRLRKLNPAVPYDLETVVLKAIGRDPGQRYQTAAAFAEDLQRFVEDRPVRARRVTPAERLWRWCRRDPRTAGLLAALLLVCAAGFGGITAEWWRAENQAKAETIARERAQQAEGEAQANLYFSLIAQAQLEWRLSNVASVERLLRQCERERRGWEWHYLHGILHADLLTLHNPSLPQISGVSFSPDGKLLAYTGWNPYRRPGDRSPSPVEIWNVQTGEHVRTLEGAVDGLRVRFSPDGRLLTVSGQSGDVQLWDVAKAHLLHVWPQDRSASFSPDGRQVALGGNEAITFWDTTTLEQVRSLPTKGGRVTFSPDGLLLAVAGPNGVELREPTSGQETQRLPYGPGGPGGNLDAYSSDGPELAFSPNGKQLVTATSPPRIWDVATGRLLNNLTGHTGTVPGVAFSPDGQQVATAGADSTVRLWDAHSGAELMVLRGHSAWVACVSFHPDGWCLATGGRQPGDVKFWDLTRHPEHLTLHGTDSQAIAFDPDSRRLNLVNIRGRFESREPVSGQTTEGPSIDLLDMTQQEKWASPANIAAYSSDCQRLAGVSGDGRSVTVWEVESGRELASLMGLAHRIVHVAISPDGQRVAAVDWPGSKSGLARQVRIWDAATGQVLASLEAAVGPSMYIHGAVAFSPDGTRVAFDDYTKRGTGEEAPALVGRVRVCDAASGQELLTLPAGDDVVFCLAFSPDGKKVATGHRSGKVLVRGMTGQLLHENQIEEAAYRVAFSPDGRRLAAVNREQVKVWDVESGNEFLALRGAPHRPSDGGFNPTLAWGPDGCWLAAMNWDGSVSVWDTTAWEEPVGVAPLRQVPERRIYAWHLNQASSALQARQPLAAKVHLDAVRPLEPPDLPLRQQRAQLFMRCGAWERAAVDFARVLADHDPDEGGVWLDHARALLLQRDMEGYRRLCGRMLAAVGSGRRPHLLTWAARVCALGPAALPDPAETVRFEEEVLAKAPREAAVLFSVGLAHYRAGNWEKALRRAQESIDAHPETAWVKWPVLAMAHYKMGHVQEARHWLDQAAEWRRQAIRRNEESAGFSWEGEWPDFQIVYAEAAELLAAGQP